MKVELINPPGLDTSGALSQGTRAGDWIFVSGQRARDSVGLIIGAETSRPRPNAHLNVWLKSWRKPAPTFPT